MLISKTVKCKIIELTKSKYNLLNEEWRKYQEFIELERAGCDWLADKVPIYASYKLQARWIWDQFRKGSFPLSITNQLLKVRKNNNKISKHWIRIPIKG